AKNLTHNNAYRQSKYQCSFR
ncbi:hypothetical protein, partial [uncultured Gammaproteobacteria bacterium]